MSNNPNPIVLKASRISDECIGMPHPGGRESGAPFARQNQPAHSADCLRNYHPGRKPH